VYRNSAFTGDLVDLGGRPHQNRFDDPKLGCLGGAAKRGFVARVHHNRLCWRYLLGFGDQTLIFRFWRMRRGTDGPKSPYFALSVSWHVDSMLFRCVAAGYDALDAFSLTSAGETARLGDRSSFPNRRL